MNNCDHIELSTDDTKNARAFYAKIFKWKFTAAPNPGGGEYLMFRSADGKGGGGVTAKMMPNQPTAWMPYITVASVKTTLKAAKSAGAQTLVDYMPIGEMGAIAVMMDPTGAAIGLWEAGKAAARPAKKPATRKAAKKRR